MDRGRFPSVTLYSYVTKFLMTPAKKARRERTGSHCLKWGEGR